MVKGLIFRKFLLVFSYPLLLLIFSPLHAEIVLNKDAPGVGVANPEEWMKDYIENELKDAVFGSEVNEGINAIFQKTYDQFIAQQERYKRCEGAAFTQAFNVAGELHNARILRGFGEMFWNIEKQLITLGSGSIAEFLQSQAEDKIRGALSDAFKDEKTEVYEETYSLGDCEQAVRAVWDKAAGTYTIFITGNCNCQEASTKWIGGRKVRLAEWSVVARGTARVVPNRDRTGLTVVASPPSISVSANCNCVLGEGDTWYPPPPIEEEDDGEESEEDDQEEEKIEEPVRMPQTGTKRVATGAKCELCVPKLEAMNRLINQFNDVAQSMNTLATEIQEDIYKSKSRDAKVERWNSLGEQLSRLEGRIDAAFDEFIECEATECQLGTGPVVLDRLSEIGRKVVICEECQEVVDAANEKIDAYNEKVRELNALESKARSEQLQFGTAEGNRVYREWNILNPAATTLYAEAQNALAHVGACEARTCLASKYEGFGQASYQSTDCPACQLLVDDYNRIVDQLNDVYRRMDEYLQKEKEYVLEHGDAIGPARDGLIKLRQDNNHHEMIVEIGRLQDQQSAMNIHYELRECEKRCEGQEEANTQISIGAVPTFNLLPELKSSFISTQCTPCQGIVSQMNNKIGEYREYSQKIREAIQRIEQIRNGATPTQEEVDFARAIYSNSSNSGDVELGMAAGVMSDDAFWSPLIGIYAVIRIPGYQDSQSDIIDELEQLRKELIACEKQCGTVSIVNVINLSGNNFLNTEDPLDEDPSNSEETVQVIGMYNIPISRLTRWDAHSPNCDEVHYHGTALDCNGVSRTDPAPGNCGHGKASEIKTIAISSCPDL